jgi:2',3'-cyclic-nucleotide 2'-phosphodiesterase (5'-nucleotidase family)
LDRQRELLPTLWLDSGDLTVGGKAGIFGHCALQELTRLPISAAAVGNHDLDGGISDLQSFARTLSFPLLCADRDAGVPPSIIVDTRAGEVGIVGITHPHAHQFAQAPPPADRWQSRVAEHAAELRRSGARWVLALLHDGATWWTGDRSTVPVRQRGEALLALTRAWAPQFDAILTGHTLTAWTGTLGGTPAGQAHAFAASVLVADLRNEQPTATLHPPVGVPPTSPQQLTPTMAALQAAAARVIAEVPDGWDSRAGSDHYLPDLVAAAVAAAAGSDAAFVPAGQLFTQAPVDGIVAALPAGPVTELDLIRLFPFSDDQIAIAELRPGEFRRLIDVHDTNSDPRNTLADNLWWNWARAPAGTVASTNGPETLAVAAFALPLLSSWLGRELTSQPVRPGGRQAFRDHINR